MYSNLLSYKKEQLLIKQLKLFQKTPFYKYYHELYLEQQLFNFNYFKNLIFPLFTTFYFKQLFDLLIYHIDIIFYKKYIIGNKKHNK